jgi:hypothetical protein
VYGGPSRSLFEHSSVCLRAEKERQKSDGHQVLLYSPLSMQKTLDDRLFPDAFAYGQHHYVRRRQGRRGRNSIESTQLTMPEDSGPRPVPVWLAGGHAEPCFSAFVVLS